MRLPITLGKASMAVSVTVDMVAKTDVGLQRSNNEDSFLLMENIGLVAVADGMGGHLGGEVASSIVAEVLAKEFETPIAPEESEEHIIARLSDAVVRANLEIHTQGNSDVRLRNMGTTVTSALFHGSRIIYASVGDSRLYRLRGDDFEQISEDHSWVGELRRKNLISAEDARRHPLKNIITRALGMENSVEVDTGAEEVQAGDVYLLCTDGLTDLVWNHEIADIIKQHLNDLDAGAAHLLSAANEMGGIDNITVGLCRISSL